MKSRKFFAVAMSVCGGSLMVGCSGQAPLSEFDKGLAVTAPYQGIEHLAAISSAIIIATPTGQPPIFRAIPRAEGSLTDPAPARFATMQVLQVIAGQYPESEIEIHYVGEDSNTGKEVLSEGGPYLLFITPAMIDVDYPLGGYVVAGGPNGVFTATDPASPSIFYSLFAVKNPLLPHAINIEIDLIPQITNSESDLIKIGPQ